LISGCLPMCVAPPTRAMCVIFMSGVALRSHLVSHRSPSWNPSFSFFPPESLFLQSTHSVSLRFAPKCQLSIVKFSQVFLVSFVVSKGMLLNRRLGPFYARVFAGSTFFLWPLRTEGFSPLFFYSSNPRKRLGDRIISPCPGVIRTQTHRRPVPLSFFFTTF